MILFFQDQLQARQWGQGLPSRLVRKHHGHLWNHVMKLGQGLVSQGTTPRLKVTLGSPDTFSSSSPHLQSFELCGVLVPVMALQIPSRAAYPGHRGSQAWLLLCAKRIMDYDRDMI